MDKGTSVIEAFESAISDKGGPTATTESKETSAATSPEVTATGTDKGKGTPGKTDKETPQTVPYSRLAEVIAEKNTALEKANEFKELYEKATTKQGDVVSKLETLEKEVDILNRVRALAQDERYKDHVEAIDKALRGVEEEVEKLGADPSEKAVDKALKNIQNANAKLEERLSEERASRLFKEASDFFDKLAEALPNEYGEADLRVIAKDCAERIDWSKVESDESKIQDLVKAAFKVSVTEYGNPRAGLEAQIQELQAKLNDGAKVTALTAQTPEKVLEGLLSKDYNQKDDKGRFVTTDADFTGDLAAFLKSQRT
jgi:hypothetical protein